MSLPDATSHYIDGLWVRSAGSMVREVTNPATERPIAKVAMGSDMDVDRAVTAARKAFGAFGSSSRKERVELLERIMAVYKRRWNELASCVTAEVGAPITLAMGAQTDAGYRQISAAVDALKSFKFEYMLGNSRILREPIGVCGMITPWNWPLKQIAAKVAPALACGCTMVLKPSEVAPLNAVVFAEILHEAGVPPGVFNLVHGDGPGVGAALAAHPDIDCVSITGSTQAGIAVAKAAAGTIKRVTQELGGKSANVVLEDADFETAVSGGVLTMMNNSGQSCNAPSRMLVPSERLSEVKEIAARALASVIVGDPESPRTTMGPVVSERQWNRVEDYIEKGVKEGCETVVGGPGRPENLEIGYFVKPTVFVAPRRDVTVVAEEIFGPVLTILGYQDVDQAIEMANDSLYGLSAYVSSKSVKRASAVARRLRAGNVHINGKWGDRITPFGGYKQSGNGREGGAFGFEEFLETKAIMGYT